MSFRGERCRHLWRTEQVNLFWHVIFAFPCFIIR
jgi:hypothetical protein